MKPIKTWLAILGTGVCLASPAFAAGKTCCEQARAGGKECAHPCCVTAHKAARSCNKCNPNQEDFKAAMTCCEKARAGGTFCSNKCCITARNNGRVCDKCNPRKESAGKKPGQSR
jgi:hypothetical protein